MMNSIAEYKGKEELYTKQSPQILKALFRYTNAECLDFEVVYEDTLP